MYNGDDSDGKDDGFFSGTTPTEENMREAMASLALAVTEASKLKGRRAANQNSFDADESDDAIPESALLLAGEETIEKLCLMLEETQMHMCRTAIEWHKSMESKYSGKKA